jgi:hypothetical protein
MHVSPAVRSLREHPVEGETVTLLIEVADGADTDGVAAALEDAGGTVTDRRRFGTLVVETAHESLGDLCGVEGLAVVETDNAAAVDADGAGEDVEFDR